MKNFTTRLMSVAACAVITTAAMASTGKMAMLVANSDTKALNSQERAAAEYFTRQFPEGELVSVADASTLSPTKYDVVWVHVDRMGIAAGANNLPDGFGSATVAEALKRYLAEGGNIYLSKHATQLVTAIERVPAKFAPSIVATGDGCNGTDVWTIQGIIGVMNDASYFPNPEPGRVFDDSQVYNHTGHEIYVGLETIPAGHPYADFATATYPMEGTGDGTEMWREDHNCMWDLNTHSFTAEGKNTTEQFERECQASVLGTWGHVQDYCVAGIVEFYPKEKKSGTVIANGLAACEWAPRSGVNAYHNNLERLTANTMSYLQTKAAPGVDGVEGVSADEAEETAPAEYFNLNGVRVNGEDVVAGIYIVKQGSKVSKVIVK